MRPIIGLTTYGRDELKVDYPYYEKFYAIPVEYVDSVRRAGGVPILLPPGEDDWSELLELTDAIIVIGGSDVNPAEYNGNADHPTLDKFDLERDAAELSLVRLLLDNKEHPTLCICRGLQVLNVAMGGTLHEHLPDVLDEDIHRGPTGWAYQPVEVDRTSKIAEIMSAEAVTTFSGHHQAVKALAAGLNITAQAADGIVEAFEVADHPWMIAVQWHPEVSAAEDPTQQALFNDLVEEARKRRASRLPVRAY